MKSYSIKVKTSSLLALRILALFDKKIAKRLTEYRTSMKSAVEKKRENLRKKDTAHISNHYRLLL